LAGAWHPTSAAIGPFDWAIRATRPCCQGSSDSLDSRAHRPQQEHNLSLNTRRLQPPDLLSIHPLPTGHLIASSTAAMHALSAAPAMRRWAAPTPPRVDSTPIRHPRQTRCTVCGAARAQPRLQPAEAAACSALALVASMGVLLSGGPAAADMIEVRSLCS
jgi:hypothetical protein